MGEPSSRLEVHGLVKHFGNIKANDGIDVRFTSGEIHALLGENGAGKSTLIKIVAGVYKPDAGTIVLDGEGLSIASPDDARKNGIAVVHQESALVPRLTIAENVALQQGGLGRLDGSLAERVRLTARQLGFSLNPAAHVEDLSVGDRQRAEITRALMADARFIMLDEPTAVLAPPERAELFELLAQLAAQGAGVVLVTHRLEEALGHSHRITVLRHGRVVTEAREPHELSERDLVRLMVGELRTESKRVHAAVGRELLQVRSLSGSPLGGVSLHSIDLSVHAGEVLGVAGVEGNGQRELAAALTGSWIPPEGVVELRGIPLSRYSSGERIRLIGDLPDDDALALSGEMSVWENLALSTMAWIDPPTPMNRARFRESAAELVRQFEIKTPRVDTRVSQLSGGNRRRVLLARELSKRPDLLVATFATKGLDVRSVQQVKHWLRELAASGTAIVFIGSDIDELVEVASRIAVLTRGRLAGVMPASEATGEKLGRLMLLDRPAEATVPA